MLVTGSPGMKCIIKKTIKVTPINVGSNKNRRRSKYCRMQPYPSTCSEVFVALHSSVAPYPCQEENRRAFKGVLIALDLALTRPRLFPRPLSRSWPRRARTASRWPRVASTSACETSLGPDGVVFRVRQVVFAPTRGRSWGHILGEGTGSGSCIFRVPCVFLVLLRG